MKQTDIAYIAGLIDGEGYIGIKRITSLTNGCVNPQYHERIQIRMVDEQAIQFIAEYLGGSHYKEKPHAHKGRALFCYQASDISAVRILKIILPYLRVKRRVAEKVIQFRKIRQHPDKIRVQITMKGRWGKPIKVNHWRFSGQYIETCEKFWKECSDINHGVV